MIASVVAFITGGNFTRLVATLLVGLAAGAWSGWQVQDWRQSKAELAKQKAAERTAVMNDKKSYDASDRYQKESAQDEQRIQTITRTVTRIVDRPVYSNVCLDDDGLHHINAARSGQAAAP